MKKQEFYKLQASGNDFILLDNINRKNKISSSFYKKFASKYCSRKLGIGADGVLVIEASKKADFKMRIFNADGSEAEMCGNGARCIGLWAYLTKKKKNVKFETKAGIIEAKVGGKSNDRLVKLKTSTPVGLKMDLSLNISGRKIKVNFINTGVPHTVIFVQGLDKIDIDKIGREVRFHKQFKPAGTNVNFVEIKSNNSLSIRTYERGVEAETLACGTGSLASAMISWFKLNPKLKKKQSISMLVTTKSKDILKVTFSAKGGSAFGGDDKAEIDNVWLEGKACLIYKGVIKEG
ncbi:MAG: diaminopimelate epimerase [Candidatus Omnitrophica bacterium]|nr:diaminopimelate epimerase [Candidatus Omnitrophota bacterium]